MSAAEAFAAINNVRAWWSGEIEGETQKLGDTFSYRHGSLHFSRHKVTELVDGKKVVWTVPEANLSFLKNSGEWNGTKIIFELSDTPEGTEVRLTHQGLKPECECYSACSGGWNAFFTGNLQRYISTGTPQPDPFPQV